MDDLDQALAALDPKIEGDYVYLSLPEVPQGLATFAVIAEAEGCTVVASVEDAASFGLPTDQPFTRISTGAHTSLHAVGITAITTSTIASRGIACNVLAGAYHDHFFVPADKGQEALALLESLSAQAAGWLADQS